MSNQLLLKENFLTVVYDPRWKLLLLTLKIEPATITSEEFIQTMSKIIPFLSQYEILGILFDLKEMAFPFTSEINEWLITKLGYNVWINHILFFSYVYPQDYAAKLGFDMFYAEMMSREKKLLEQADKTEVIQGQRRMFFDNREQALQWLHNKVKEHKNKEE